ncbi:HNH endonuclease [Aphanothece hegewaldii CCALA 016]|uniref:HNH endonuclease n=1 Tax=Aphanothece hegewaldii CCALA 016 TaxID=2107694 RepID=A0A2T1LUM5_9CHRO|nr:HNH endonuclease [Aphanothece hegewaldii]PSF35257.1 HNH endonuclease [Aphanothece hegewaldii CCALA 016]
MATFLLTWNSKRWHWNDFTEMVQLVQSGQLVTTRWSCGNSKRLKKGDRVFFIKLGQEPKGIFASGSVVQNSYEDLHWHQEKASLGETVMFVHVRFETLLNPEITQILPRQSLNLKPLAAMHWDTQMSGIQIPENIALELEKLWLNFVNSEKFSSPEEVSQDKTYYEGAVQQITVNAYERNFKARQECIKHYGINCFVCGFNFGQVFGDLGDGFIHIHHLHPLSEIKKEYNVNPIEDLRPICPNCHAMIHRRSPPLSIEEIQTILSKSKG